MTQPLDQTTESHRIDSDSLATLRKCWETTDLYNREQVNLLEALGESIIPKFELKLIEAGMENTCCCNNGRTAVQAWCEMEFGNFEEFRL